MTITREQVDSTLIISLHGKLDTNAAPILDQEIKKGLDGIKELYWDFSDLDYITSAGIRELLIAKGMLGDNETMKIIHANDAIKNAFYLTGLNDLLGV